MSEESIKEDIDNNSKMIMGGYLLRPILQFKKPLIYYTAIILDLILRMLWFAKLNYYNFYLLDLSPNIYFGLEFLEILRRSMWLYFRIENEFISQKLCEI